MKSSIGRIGTGLLALGFAALLASCGGGDGGGGNNPILIFFGMNNDERCTSVVIDVDVDAADSILSRNGNAVDCLLNATLDSGGCDVSFSEIDDGRTLRVTISGCNVAAVTNLYQCNFDDADLSELADATSAQCICQSPPCDTTPPICVSQSISPGSCEDCDNNQDDDDNDLVDCDDPNCEHSPLCEGVTTTTNTIDTTTSTTSSTTTTETVTTTTDPGQTTTTTTLGPTTTTTIPGPQQCTVTFRLIDNVTAGSLQWETDYSLVDGGFVGAGEAVECFGLIEQALPAFFDDEGDEVLTSGLVKLTGIDGPADLAECTVFATSSPSLNDFIITVTEASEPDLDDIIPLPDVVASELGCVSVTTTTIPGETTTTIPGETTTTTVPGVTTTTLPPTGSHRITFRLLTSSGPLNALQLGVDYQTAPGEFVGELDLVDCLEIQPMQVFAPNDEDAERELTLGIIALNAFSAPLDLINCSFEATDELSNPLPTDFDVTIVDSTNEAGQPIAVTIGVTVTPTP